MLIYTIYLNWVFLYNILILILAEFCRGSKKYWTNETKPEINDEDVI